MNHHLYFPKSFNFVFSFCVFTCSSYVQLHCLAQLSDWTHFHFLGTVFTDPLGYWVSDWMNEWMNELARIPIRAMASCLAGIPWEDLARGASGGERGVLVYVGVSFGCSYMMTIFVPFMSTVQYLFFHLPRFLFLILGVCIYFDWSILATCLFCLHLNISTHAVMSLKLAIHLTSAFRTMFFMVTPEIFLSN